MSARSVWAFATVAIVLLGAALIVRGDIATRREAFQADARVAHRLLSQRMSQHEAILATLALQAPVAAAGPARESVGPLPPGYPQLLAAWSWPPETAATASVMRLGPVDARAGRYWLLLPLPQRVLALHLDARQLWTPEEWPFDTRGPDVVQLRRGGDTLTLQAGAPEQARPAGLTEGFRFVQPLASGSQPFVLHVTRATGPAEWPWPLLVGWVLLCAAAAWTVRRSWLARQAARRAAELARLAQVARLNTMGEMAAGIAHELNQPLTAVLAGTQTALRAWREQQESRPRAAGDGTPGDDEDTLAAALPALELAAAQARRAADVVARLRRLVQPASREAVHEAVDIGPLARQLVGWMQPEFTRHGVEVQVDAQAPAAWGDRVAVEQILHNLLLNALHAVQAVPPERRRIVVRSFAGATEVHVEVHDSGPGVAPANRARLFEPFFTTRADGLGLGLPLCQSLAQGMGGQLELVVPAARPEADAGGACFRLTLPAATPP